MEIELQPGFKTIVDEEDWVRLNLSQYKWRAKKNWDGKYYVVAQVWCSVKKKSTSLRIHRLILDAPQGMMVDHRDGNTLNNSSSNLRLATNSQNQHNSGSRRGTSKFKGVSWYARSGKWQVAFKLNGKQYCVGYFDDEVEAARAYNEAVKPIAGEFARLNVFE